MNQLKRTFHLQNSGRRIVKVVYFLSAIYFCWPAQAQQPNSANLAKVAIIDFEDRTGSANYTYLSGSLSTAINTSMQTKFDYASLDAETAQTVALELRKKSGKFESSEAAEFCRATGTDILVYGSYEIDPQTGQIAMKTKINFAIINRIVTLEPILNPVDATLFQATEIMASKIVEKIGEMARKTMSANASAATDSQKVALSKIDEVSWNKVDREINILGGFLINGTDELSRLNKGYLIGIEILRNSDFRKSYAGLAALLFDQSGGNITHTGSGIMGQFGLNFFTIDNRIKPFVEANIGYGNNKLSSQPTQLPGAIWLGFRVGIKILLTSRISLAADWRYLHITGDTTSSMSVVQGGLGFNF